MDQSRSLFRSKWLIYVMTCVFCYDNLQFSVAQTSAPPTAGELTSPETLHGCDSATRCFLNETLLDPLLNCSVDKFGETDPPCYGHWSSASSCTCNRLFYRISSADASYFCNPDGTWDTGIYDLQCLAPCITDADEVAIPRNSQGNVNNIIKDGDFVNYTCPGGYTGSGSQTVNCNDGVWNKHQQFNCTEIAIDAYSTTPSNTETTESVTNDVTENITKDGTEPTPDSMTTPKRTTKATDGTTKIFTFNDTPILTEAESFTTSNANTESTQVGLTTSHETTLSADSTTEISTSDATRSTSTVVPLTTQVKPENSTTSNVKTDSTHTDLTTSNATTSRTDISELFTFHGTPITTVGNLTTPKSYTDFTHAELTTLNRTTRSGESATDLSTFRISSTSTVERMTTQVKPENSTTSNVNTESTHTGLATSNATTSRTDISELFTFHGTPITTVENLTTTIPLTEVPRTDLKTTNGTPTFADTKSELFTSTPIPTIGNLTTPNSITDFTQAGSSTLNRTTRSGDSTTELSTLRISSTSTVERMTTQVEPKNSTSSNVKTDSTHTGLATSNAPTSRTDISEFFTFHGTPITTVENLTTTIRLTEIPRTDLKTTNGTPTFFDTKSELFTSTPIPTIGNLTTPNSNTDFTQAGSTTLNRTTRSGDSTTTFRINSTSTVGCGEYFDTSPSNFSSPGFPVQYDNNLKCYYRAEALAGYVVMLTFLSVDVEQHATCLYDDISVYDGRTENAVLMAKICGDFKPLSMYSTGNDMLVTFETDESVTGRGFEATFTFKNESSMEPTEPCFLPTDAIYFSNNEYPLPDGRIAFIKCNDGFLPSEPVNLQCSNGTFQPNLSCNSTGCNSFFTTSPSYFASPSYSNYLKCFFTAEAPSGNVVLLTFTKFQMPSEMLCRYDYVSVYDGNTTQQDPIAKFCGDATPETVYSAGNAMVVTISTNSYSQEGEEGFEAYFTFINNVSIPATENCKPPQNGSFVGYTGAEVSNGHTVIVRCDAGFRPGGEAIRQCVNGTFYPILDCNSTGCLEHFTSSPSFFSSVGSPSYEKYLTCFYSAESPPGYVIELQFTEFSVYEYEMCWLDVVSVFDGLSTEDDLMATFCGSNVPCPLFSTGNRMLITFKTDGNTYSYETGFKATVLFFKNSSIPYNDNCYPPESAYLVNELNQSVSHGHTAVLACNEGYQPTEMVLLQCCNGTFKPFFECKSEFTTTASTTSVTTESVSSRTLLTTDETTLDATSSDSTTTSETTLESTTDRMSSTIGTTMHPTTASDTTALTTSLTTIPSTTTAPEQKTTSRTTTSFDPTTFLTTPGTTFLTEITTEGATTSYETTRFRTTTPKISTLTLTSEAYDSTSEDATTEMDRTSTEETTANEATTKDITTGSQMKTTLPTTVPTTSDPCHIVFNMTEGSFKSPGNGSNYFNNMSCTYSAIASQGKVVLLTFESFNLQDDPLCHFDVLKVYEGLSEKDPCIATLCGYDVPESVVSPGHEMFVTFESDRSFTFEGFQASFVFMERSSLPKTSDCDLPENSRSDRPPDIKLSHVPHSHTAVLKCNEGFVPEEAVNSQCINGSFRPLLVCLRGESFLERRYILPHLTSKLEPLVYNLGFMDNNLENTSFVRVRTPNGRSLGDFYGGVLSTFQHSLPNEFGQTLERSTLEVQSTGKVHLYISTSNSTNQFLGFPIEWLGTDYLLSTSPLHPSSSFIVSAMEVDTKVSIFFPYDFVLDSVTYNFTRDLRRTLFELQSFSIKTPFDISGTYIKASKPVAVMMNDIFEENSCSGSFYVPPISSWGTSYSFASSLYSNISFSVTAAYNDTLVSVNPHPVNCGEGGHSLTLDSWSKRDFINFNGCRIEVSSNQSVFVVVTEYSDANICNTFSVPSKERASPGKPGIPVFTSPFPVGSNLRVLVSNDKFESLQVDGNTSYSWDVIGGVSQKGTIVETQVEPGYHVISSTSKDARLLITVDRKLYAAHEESKENTDVCPFDRLFYSGVELTFYATFSGITAQSIEVCNTGSSSNVPLASRYCENNSWGEPVLEECYSPEDVSAGLEETADTIVTEENVEQVAGKVALLTSQTEDLNSTDVGNAADSLESIVQAGSSSPDVTDSVVGTVNNLMYIEEETLAEAEETSTVVESLEQQISNVQQNPDNFTEVEDNVAVKAVKINPNITKAITFANLSPGNGSDSKDVYSNLTEENTVLYNNETEVKNESSVSSIYLPPKILQLAEEVDPNNVRLPFSFLIYKDSRLFQTSMSEKTDESGMIIREDIFSQVISAKVEIEELVIANLSSEDSIVARFSEVVGDNVTILDRTCVYWAVSDDTGKGRWLDDGCNTETTESNARNETVCYCSHLTSFAVLFRVVDGEYEKIQSLDLITKIGTSLSVVGLTACVMTLTLIKKLRVKQPTKIHVNLCLCLIAFYVSFLAGDFAIGKDPQCRNLATASHYFCLVTIAWTCGEAVNMYVLFVKYARSNVKFFIPVSLVLCYGLPLIPTLLVYFLDEPRELNDYCFLHPGNSLYYGFLLEILLMIIFNIFVFTLVVRRVVFRPMLSTNAQSNKREEVIARIQQFILFWVLLGLSWTFGFLVAIPNRRTIAIEVLFCIFISLQGFILFFFICVKNPEIKKAFQKTAKRRFSKKEGYQMKNLQGPSSMFSSDKTDPKLQRVSTSKKQLFLDHSNAGDSSSELVNTHSTFTGTDLSEGETLVSEERKQTDYNTINTRTPEMIRAKTLEGDPLDMTENGREPEIHGMIARLEHFNEGYSDEETSEIFL